MIYNVIYKELSNYIQVQEKEAIELSKKKSEFKCFQFKTEKLGMYPITSIRMVDIQNSVINYKEWRS
ncbi:MAG: hypothetical protein PHF21_02655 [Bacilli bacterium]|nr:hypothetical protein [Bacilli bacterium]